MLSSSLKNNKSLKEQLEEANVKIKRLENENKTLQIKVKFLQKSKNKLLKEVESYKIFSLSTKLSYHSQCWVKYFIKVFKLQIQILEQKSI